MGLIRMGPPEELILQLLKVSHFESFIETGTYRGDTAKWAAHHFKQVISIELSKAMYDHASARCKDDANIQLVFGDTRAELASIVPRLATPCLFWLDAHWSGGDTYGEHDECPLLKEIELAGMSGVEHTVLIDDARHFLSPPQPPHRPEQWPAIAEVIHRLNQPHDRYIVIIEDVVVAVPISLKRPVIEYCQKVNARSWSSHTSGGRTSRMSRLLHRLRAD